MKLVIVGGVAGGASAAARARRLDEQAEIIVFERGAHPSFANCGLPYYIGGEITERQKLLVAPVELLENRLGLDVRVRTEVLAIDRSAKTVTYRQLDSEEVGTETYDKLILSPGARPFLPPTPGITLPGVYTLRDLKDADQLHEVAQHAKRAVIVGAGFIGLEMAENLVNRGIQTTLVELGDQIMPPLDR
jgi:NADPH-dependent 2,4-dienoyl-CoA reductase/sulfur reductase-like enzyme